MKHTEDRSVKEKGNNARVQRNAAHDDQSRMEAECGCIEVSALQSPEEINAIDVNEIWADATEETVQTKRNFTSPITGESLSDWSEMCNIIQTHILTKEEVDKKGCTTKGEARTIGRCCQRPTREVRRCRKNKNGGRHDWRRREASLCWARRQGACSKETRRPLVAP